MLGLPDRTRACLFDLDGVLTRTAEVHLTAWRETFDEYLRDRHDAAAGAGRSFSDDDYRRYVDGRARLDGVRGFLASRGIELPEGGDADGPDVLSVHGLGRRKQQRFLDALERDGVAVYEGSVRYVRAARDAGLRLAVVTASANAGEVLRAAGLDELLPVRVDGVVAAEERLAGKPAPDTFLSAARLLDVAPADAAVFEDARSGVRAARTGGFGWVVGVDRVGNPHADADAPTDTGAPAGLDADGHAAELRRCGADVVVRDLAELLGSA